MWSHIGGRNGPGAAGLPPCQSASPTAPTGRPWRGKTWNSSGAFDAFNRGDLEGAEAFARTPITSYGLASRASRDVLLTVRR